MTLYIRLEMGRNGIVVFICPGAEKSRYASRSALLKTLGSYKCIYNRIYVYLSIRPPRFLACSQAYHTGYRDENQIQYSMMLHDDVHTTRLGSAVEQPNTHHRAGQVVGTSGNQLSEACTPGDRRTRIIIIITRPVIIISRISCISAAHFAGARLPVKYYTHIYRYHTYIFYLHIGAELLDFHEHEYFITMINRQR